MVSLDVGCSRLLAIGAHADDVEYGIGGWLQRFSSARVVVVTDGRPARVRETEAAARILNYQPAILDYAENDVNLSRLVVALDAILAGERPDLIAVHWPNDTHQDHRAAAAATLAAARNFDGAIVFYRSPSSADFAPNFLVALTDDEWRDKLAAIRAHASQMSKPFLSDKALRAVALSWPVLWHQDAKLCEPFALHRLIVG